MLLPLGETSECFTILVIRLCWIASNGIICPSRSLCRQATEMRAWCSTPRHVYQNGERSLNGNCWRDDGAVAGDDAGSG